MLVDWIAQSGSRATHDPICIISESECVNESSVEDAAKYFIELKTFWSQQFNGTEVQIEKRGCVVPSVSSSACAVYGIPLFRALSTPKKTIKNETGPLLKK